MGPGLADLLDVRERVDVVFGTKWVKVMLLFIEAEGTLEV
jgi:hypothetical protein